jgi:hypothetical protein
VSYDQQRRETEHLLALRADVERELARFAGVVGVGIGIRECCGALTPELGFRVYVRQKRPKASLPARQIIPRSVAGYPTDVHVMGLGRPECCGATRPLLGGLPMATSPSSELARKGTIGCFLNINGKLVGLTNRHVTGAIISENPSEKAIFQPERKDFIGTCNQIGVSDVAHAVRGDVSVGGVTHWVDAAAVVLQKVAFINKIVAIENSEEGAQAVPLPSGVVGTVRANEDGEVVDIRNEANGLVNTTLISGTGSAVLQTLVWKVGGTSKLTVGVVDSIGPATFRDTAEEVVAPNQVNVKPIAGFKSLTNGQLTFSEEGDSGSVYLDLSNHIVAHHHHSSFASQQGWRSHGSHFAAVLSALGAQLATDGGVTHQTSAPSNELARSLWAEAPLRAHDLDGLEAALRKRLAKTEQGRDLIRILDLHMPEVLRLVWTRRAVTVVWHRHQGPAFVALFARALAKPGEPFPTEAGGISRRALLNALCDMLEAYGSESLRYDLEAVRPWLLDVLASCKNVDSLCDLLSERAA